MTRKPYLLTGSDVPVVIVMVIREQASQKQETRARSLPLDWSIKPVKQKLRRLKPEWSLKVKEEVVKQFNVLRVVTYPEWLANIVPVPKKDGKVRMCIDFRDLNKASPKDDFPLLHLDILVDNTAGHEMFSFMDGFSGYNQIKIAPEDQDKTAFITPWGVYCYQVMPFGLKNAGATYQKAMVTVFHDMMHKEMEVYVDDMIVKSRAQEDHLVNLRKVFDRLRSKGSSTTTTRRRKRKSELLLPAVEFHLG